MTELVIPGDARLQVVKSLDEQRFTLGVSYYADRLDGHGEYMPAGEVEASAWAYLAKHRSVGLYHADGTEGHGTVVESYIYRGPEWAPTAADGTVQKVLAGDWLLGVIWDEPAWALYKSGRIDGLSMQGKAIRRLTPDATLRG